MPFYTFKCPSCNRKEEILQSMKAPKPVCKRCINASCGTHTPEMKRVFKDTGKPQFKGSGFYETDYKKKGGG
jgi:putative FmdB family regulatory protein